MTDRTATRADLRYRRPMPVLWWVRKPTYFLFVMRELSSLFIAWLVLFLVLMVRAVSRGEEEYAAFLDWAGSPWLVTLNVVAFLFALLHTVTWFLVTPQALVLKVGGRRVPGAAIIAAQYAALAVVSGFVVWLVTR